MSDLISRKAAIDAVHCRVEIKDKVEAMAMTSAIAEIVRNIAELPSAQPKQGRWMTERYEYGRCSNCRGYAIETENGYYFSDYCPNCGAKMEVEHE